MIGLKPVNYIPDRQDVVWINFDPQAGREQAKRRPALVFSPKSYNRASGLCLVCPIRSCSKGWSFDVSVDFEEISGFIISDQLRSMDWQSRNIQYITTVPMYILEQARDNFLTLIE